MDSGLHVGMGPGDLCDIVPGRNSVESVQVGVKTLTVVRSVKVVGKGRRCDVPKGSNGIG